MGQNRTMIQQTWHTLKKEKRYPKTENHTPKPHSPTLHPTQQNIFETNRRAYNNCTHNLFSRITQKNKKYVAFKLAQTKKILGRPGDI